MAAAGITRIFPDLTEDLLLNLFHKGAQVQWTSRSLDWSTPIKMSERQRLALARLLTPVYFGEQSAMAGASAILPSVMAAGETTAQLYLATFILDEARHFETLTRLYQTLAYDPLGIRDMPELLRYYHRLRQGDRVDWVWGILISDIIGKHFYRELGPKQAQPDPFFGGLTTRILQDESRHLAFAEHYLKQNLPKLAPERRRAMVEMRDELMRLLESMTHRVREDALAFDVEIEDFLVGVGGELDGVARRVGLLERRPRPPTSGGGGTSPRALSGGASVTRVAPEAPADDDSLVARCFGCLLSLICGQRLAAA
ncbi:MAG TPA: diiron oxygenase [Chloroflexota bacterium]